MPDEAYGQVDYSDKIAARRQERAEQAQGGDSEPPKPDPRIDQLMARLTALEAWRDNLQGTNGITVTDGVIGYNPPPIVANAICNGDGSIVITITQ